MAKIALPAASFPSRLRDKTLEQDRGFIYLLRLAYGDRYSALDESLHNTQLLVPTPESVECLT